MRLNKIEVPKNPKVISAYTKSKLYFGKVITPLKVVYSRAPGAIRIANEINNFFFSKLNTDKRILTLIKGYTSILNNCEFCFDIAKTELNEDKEYLEKYNALENYESSKLFSDKEKAVLKYVEEATNLKNVSDETFEDLKKYFSEEEIVEIILTCAIEHYYNVTNFSLRIESDNLNVKEPVQPEV